MSPVSPRCPPRVPAAAENVLKRMTIIGEILSFRSMAQQGLREVGTPRPWDPEGPPTPFGDP